MSYSVNGESDLSRHKAIEFLNAKLSDECANHKKSKNPAVGWIYSFTNENLDKVYEKTYLKNKRAMVIGSSIDQVIYAILHGCKDITSIDGNPLTQPYGELKLAAIKNLEFEEFIDYFSKCNILNYKCYWKVCHDLSPYARLFWDEIMLSVETNPKGNRLLRYLLFQNGGHCFENKKGLDYYKYKSVYNRIKENLKDTRIKFIVADFSEFYDMLDGKYGLMLLSNIKDYVDEKDFFDVVNKLHRDKLDNRGKMQIYYDFAPTEFTREYYDSFLKHLDKKNFKIKTVEDARFREFYKKYDLKPKECNVLFL